MKNISIDLYKNGYNCCEAIIMAADKKYKLNISKESIRFASGINNGMGVGSLCSAIIGGIMVIGYIFGDNNSLTKLLRMKFINCVECELKSINCMQICRNPISKGSCVNVISIIANILDRIICESK